MKRGDHIINPSRNRAARVWLIASNGVIAWSPYLRFVSWLSGSFRAATAEECARIDADHSMKIDHSGLDDLMKGLGT